MRHCMVTNETMTFFVGRAKEISDDDTPFYVIANLKRDTSNRSDPRLPWLPGTNDTACALLLHTYA